MTRTPTTAHGFTEGDLVRVKKSGRLIRLEDVNPTDRWKEDESFASGNGEHGTEDILSPDDIEKVDEPKITLKDIAPAVASALHGGFGDDLQVTETEVDGQSVYAYGTFKGIPIEFTVNLHDLGVRL